MQNFHELLGTDFPLIQAPMAGAQGAAMTLAVCKAGALGSLPCAMLSPDALRKELRAMQSATSKPYNVNFFCHQQPKPDAAVEAAWGDKLMPYYRELGIDRESSPPTSLRAPFSHEMADVLSEFKPAIISFHFGLPAADLLERLTSWKPLILSTATTIDEAQWLEERGVSAVIAQGLEAGGHRGHFLTRDVTQQMGTFALIPQVRRAVNVPVIAEGGIADVNGISAAMSLGAAGVQIGTSYLLCSESTITPAHRALLKREDARRTALTNLFTGGVARGIVNRLMRELGPFVKDVPEFPLAAAGLAPLRAAAERRGSSDFSPVWSGQNSTGCKEISATELTNELASAFA